jgi:hypothetical protein
VLDFTDQALQHQPRDGRVAIKEVTMNIDTHHHVHALVDQLPPMQLAALETILQSMLDPLSSKLALAPTDDEPFTEEDRRAIAEADECSKTRHADCAGKCSCRFRADDDGLGDDRKDSGSARGDC